VAHRIYVYFFKLQAKRYFSEWGFKHLFSAEKWLQPHENAPTISILICMSLLLSLNMFRQQHIELIDICAVRCQGTRKTPVFKQFLPR
jgi:hypothetical protein